MNVREVKYSIVGSHQTDRFAGFLGGLCHAEAGPVRGLDCLFQVRPPSGLNAYATNPVKARASIQILPAFQSENSLPLEVSIITLAAKSAAATVGGFLTTRVDTEWTGGRLTTELPVPTYSDTPFSAIMMPRGNRRRTCYGSQSFKCEQSNGETENDDCTLAIHRQIWSQR